MHALDLALATLTAVILLPWILVAFAWPAHRGVMALQLAAAMLVPILLLVGYITLQRRVWNWAVLPFDSLVPHLIAATLFLGALAFILARSKAHTGYRVALGITTIIGWVTLALWWLASMRCYLNLGCVTFATME